MEDSRIVQLYWDRDQDAITRTAEKYGRYCTSIARNILGNREDAEECVNDTYLGAWNAMPSHRPERLAAFLGKITRNLSFNRYRKNHADKRGGSEMPEILEELCECVSGKEDVESEMEYRQLVQTVNDFLAELPQEKRNIFIRRYWYSERVADIAKAYGIRENTVSMMLNRLRKKLRTYLTERGYEI